MRILVCGQRDFSDPHLLYEVLDCFLDKTDVVIDGGAPGADSLAYGWAVMNNKISERYFADWKKYGRAAGPIRNEKMLEEGKPDLVLAFYGENPEVSKGTANMVKLSRKAGIPVQEYYTGGEF